MVQGPMHEISFSVSKLVTNNLLSISVFRMHGKFNERAVYHLIEAAVEAV